jgi:hypothetical protein
VSSWSLQRTNHGPPLMIRHTQYKVAKHSGECSPGPPPGHLELGNTYRYLSLPFKHSSPSFICVIATWCGTDCHQQPDPSARFFCDDSTVDWISCPVRHTYLVIIHPHLYHSTRQCSHTLCGNAFCWYHYERPPQRRRRPSNGGSNSWGRLP